MPELPEVETVKKALELKVKNRKITNLNVLYPNIFSGEEIDNLKEKILGETINSVSRRGKWLIFNLDHYHLLSHLRMEGKYLYKTRNDEIKKHEHVIFTLDNDLELRYQDTRKFGKMHLIKKGELDSDNSPLKSLGLEPFDENLNIAYLKDKFKNKKLPIKTVLLDQSIVTGIGNIYANEICFRMRIDPKTAGNKLSEKRTAEMIEVSGEILSEAIKQGGTTIHSFDANGVTGLFQTKLQVHMQKECPTCGGSITKEKVNGRGTYYCKKCQRRQS